MDMEECRPSKDFLRHIASSVIGDYAEKLPANVIDDIRSRLGRAEDKYRFTIYGGDPGKLVDYFKSNEWADLVEYVQNIHAEGLLKTILRNLAEEYRNACPSVAEEASRILEKGFQKALEHRITLDNVYRALKYTGYKVSLDNKNAMITLEAPGVTASIQVVDGRIVYTMCKKGGASTIEAFLSRFEKLREL